MAAFYILQKNFSGRKTHRYFHRWDKAKEEMDKDVAMCCKDLNGKVVQTIDRMNVAKGWYEYEKTAHFPNGEDCRWALLDGYFEDEPND